MSSRQNPTDIFPKSLPVSGTVKRTVFYWMARDRLLIRHPAINLKVRMGYRRL